MYLPEEYFQGLNPWLKQAESPITMKKKRRGRMFFIAAIIIIIMEIRFIFEAYVSPAVDFYGLVLNLLGLILFSIFIDNTSKKFLKMFKVYNLSFLSHSSNSCKHEGDTDYP